MVQTTEILKILHGMQHDLQAIDQKHTLLLSHTKAQKEKADQALTDESIEENPYTVGSNAYNLYFDTNKNSNPAGF